MQARTAFHFLTLAVLLFLTMPSNCSAASLLPQFYKHSNSADLPCKSLLSHVWAGLKVKSLFVQARTAFHFLTLAVLLFLTMPSNCSAASLLPQFYKHSNSADLPCKSLPSHVWAGLKVKSLFVRARTAFHFLTLASS